MTSAPTLAMRLAWRHTRGMHPQTVQRIEDEILTVARVQRQFVIGVRLQS
jgi:hypothetical protein